MQCVRGCQHPWFGGNGACVEGPDGAPACACDSGFSTLDVLGQPSCEPKAVRTACHAVGCVLAVACFAFAARKLGATLRKSFEGGNSTRAGSSPRGVGGGMQASSQGLYTRPRTVRLLLFTSILWGMSVLIFHVIAWRTRLTLETLFPLMTFAVAWGAVGGVLSLRLWLFVLPSRLMGNTSVPTVIKAWSDDRHGLAIVASCYWVWLILCGIVGRFNSLRARLMMLGSTGPMVGFYALVVLSVSLTLSKAIRESERSAALQQSSSNKGSVAVSAAATTSYDIKRWALAWARRDVGSSRGQGGEGAGADTGGSRNVGAAGKRTIDRPKANGGYGKTKSMLKKLTRASVAVMATVMVIIVSGLHQGTIAHDTPLIFFMALFTTMPSVWLIITMRFLARESATSSSSAAAVVVSAASKMPTSANVYPADTGGVAGTKSHPNSRCSPGWRLQHIAEKVVVEKKMAQKLSEKHRRVRDAPVVPAVLHQ